jgi:hypothetical protein
LPPSRSVGQGRVGSRFRNITGTRTLVSARAPGHPSPVHTAAIYHAIDRVWFRARQSP